MAKSISRLSRMILFGLTSFSLGKTRRRRHYKLPRKFLTAPERWVILGNRLREAADKVVGQNER